MIQNELFNVLASTLNIPVNTITMSSSSENIEQWDSLMHMNVIFAIEEAFNVMVPDDKITEVTSVAALLEVINENN